MNAGNVESVCMARLSLLMSITIIWTALNVQFVRPHWWVLPFIKKVTKWYVRITWVVLVAAFAKSATKPLKTNTLRRKMIAIIPRVLCAPMEDAGLMQDGLVEQMERFTVICISIC